MASRRPVWALALLVLSCAACAGPARRGPPTEVGPPLGVEPDRRVFVPARPQPAAEPPPVKPPPVAAEEEAPTAPAPLAELEAPPPPPPVSVAEPPPPAPPESPSIPVEERAGTLVVEGRFAEALDALGTVDASSPPATRRLRAEALEGLGRRPEALWAYVAALPGAEEPTAGELRTRIRVLLDGFSEPELEQVAAACPLCTEGGYARLRRARLRHAAGDPAAEALLSALVADFAGHPLGREAEALLEEWSAARAVQPGLYGLLLPLSGPLQAIGERALRGALLASGLLGGGPDPGVRLAVADSRGEPEAAAQAVRRLAGLGVLGIAGPLKGSAAAEAARVARELGVPLVAPTPAPEAAGGGAFRLYLREEDEVAGLAERAVGVAGHRRFAILYPDSQLGRRYRDLFWAEVVARGGEITGVESFPPGSRDHGDAIRRLTGVFELSDAEVRERFVERERARLLRERELLVALGLADQPGTGPEGEGEVPVDPARLAKYKPEPIVDFEAVFLPVSAMEAAQIAPQFPFHDVVGTSLLGIRTWNYPTLVEVGEESVSGALFAAEFHPGLDEARDFAAAYQAEYGEAPGVIEAYAYDAVRLLVSATAAPGAETRPALRRRLESLWASPAVTGPLTTHPGGDIAAQPKILTVRRGRIAPAAR